MRCAKPVVPALTVTAVAVGASVLADLVAGLRAVTRAYPDRGVVPSGIDDVPAGAYRRGPCRS
jgi:hypothetical protein